MLNVGSTVKVPANMLKPNPNHIRSMRDGWENDPELVSMAKTIMNKQYKPLQVYSNYIIDDGHRRWMAVTKLVPNHKLNCHIVENPNDKSKSLLSQLISDHHTKTLSKTQKACGVRELKSAGHNGTEIAKRMKVSDGYVSQLLKFSENPKFMDAYDSGEMTWEEIYKILYPGKDSDKDSHNLYSCKDSDNSSHGEGDLSDSKPLEAPSGLEPSPIGATQPTFTNGFEISEIKGRIDELHKSKDKELIEMFLEDDLITTEVLGNLGDDTLLMLDEIKKFVEDKKPKEKPDKKLEKAESKKVPKVPSNSQWNKLIDEVELDIEHIEGQILGIIEKSRRIEEHNPDIKSVVKLQKTKDRINALSKRLNGIVKKIDENLEIK